MFKGYLNRYLNIKGLEGYGLNAGNVSNLGMQFSEQGKLGRIAYVHAV